MQTKSSSRRDFIKAAGIVLGGTALVGSGLTVLDAPQPRVTYPEYTFGEENMSKRILVTYASQAG